jgi:hypothetical protein
MKNLGIVVCAYGALLTPWPVLAQDPFALPPPRPNGQYEIRGVVVDAQSGQPLPEVELSIQDSAQPTGPAFEVLQSEAHGSFRFANLAEGKYSVRASRQGYAEQEYLQHENFWSGIAVGPGKDSTHLQFPLSPSAAITGRVTDENGDPVRGADITLWAEQLQNGEHAITQAQNTQTDDQGSYRAGHLLPGKYSVSVQATPWYSRYNSPGSVPASDATNTSNLPGTQVALPDAVYPVLYYPNARDWHDMEWMTLRAGQTETADLHLIAEPSAHLHVRIGTVDDRQRPNVALSTEFPGGGLGTTRGNLAISNSGIAEFSGIAAGRYLLTRVGGPVDISGDGQKVDVSGSSDLTLDEAPAGGRAVRGVLRMDDGELQVNETILRLRDAQGHTFAGVYSSPPGEGAIRSGSFVIENLPAGPQVFELSIEQPLDLVVQKIEAKGAKVSGTTIEIDGTQDVHLVVTVTQSSRVIEGTVMKNGKSFAGAMILLIPADGKGTDRRVRRDQSDSDGTFRLATVLPGRYSLMALEQGWEMEWAKPEVLQPFLGKAMKLDVRDLPAKPVVVEVQ